MLVATLESVFDSITQYFGLDDLRFIPPPPGPSREGRWNNLGKVRRLAKARSRFPSLDLERVGEGEPMLPGPPTSRYTSSFAKQGRTIARKNNKFVDIKIC